MCGTLFASASLFQRSIAFLVSSLLLAGCATVQETVPNVSEMSPTTVGAATGAVIGSGLGAVIGSATGDAGAGLAIGAVAGTAAGALVGAAIENQNDQISAQKDTVQQQQEQIGQNRRQIDEMRQDLTSDRKTQDKRNPTSSKQSLQTTTVAPAALPDARANISNPSRATFASNTAAAGAATTVGQRRVAQPYQPNPQDLVTAKVGQAPKSPTAVIGSISAAESVSYSPPPPPAAAQPSSSLPSASLPPSAGKRLPESDKPDSFDYADEEASASPIKGAEEQGDEAVHAGVNDIDPKPEQSRQAKVAEPTLKSAASSATLPPDKNCQEAGQEAKRGHAAASDADKLFYLRRAIRLCPTHVPFHIQVGILYETIGRKEDAAYEFRQVLDLDPQNAEAKQRLAALEGDLAETTSIVE